jgi:hypothetical protein
LLPSSREPLLSPRTGALLPCGRGGRSPSSLPAKKEGHQPTQEQAGSATVGLRREVIPAGKQSFPRHAHMAEEEIFVAVRGCGTLLDTLITQ